MYRTVLAIISLIFVAVACEQPDPNERQVFRIKSSDVAKIQFRHLDTVNAIRQTHGLRPVNLSPLLTAAARTHASDISRQNRPWHFGSNGSNPLERVKRTGYTAKRVAENLSETFENDLETLQAWMRDPVTRAGILDPKMRNLGFGWHQEENGKIWWVQVLAS